MSFEGVFKACEFRVTKLVCDLSCKTLNIEPKSSNN
jgi:hypothetical protein